MRVNLIAPGFVDTPLSASLLGDRLEARRAELRKTLPIGRSSSPLTLAALALHIMTSTAITRSPTTSMVGNSSPNAMKEFI